MANALPQWVLERYIVLWKKFGSKEFTFEQAEQSLNNKKGLNTFLSGLKKNGWMEVKLSPKDSRIRLYKLKDPEKTFRELIVSITEITTIRREKHKNNKK